MKRAVILIILISMTSVIACNQATPSNWGKVKRPVAFLGSGSVDTVFSETGPVVLCDSTYDGYMKFTIFEKNGNRYKVKAESFWSDIIIQGEIKTDAPLWVQPKYTYPYEESLTRIYKQPSTKGPYEEALLLDRQKLVDISGKWIKIEVTDAWGRDKEAGWIPVSSITSDYIYAHHYAQSNEKLQRLNKVFLHPLRDDVVELVQRDTVLLLQNDYINDNYVFFKLLDKEGEWYKVFIQHSRGDSRRVYGKIRSSSPLWIIPTRKLEKTGNTSLPYEVRIYNELDLSLDLDTGSFKDYDFKELFAAKVIDFTQRYLKIETDELKNNTVVSGWIYYLYAYCTPWELRPVDQDRNPVVPLLCPF